MAKLRSDWMLRRVLKNKEDLLSLETQWKLPVTSDVKTYVVVVIIIKIMMIIIGKNGSHNPIQKIRQQKRICNLVDFTVPIDYRMKVKKNEKLGKYLDCAKMPKMPRNKKMTVISIIVGVLRAIPKSLGVNWRCMC